MRFFLLILFLSADIFIFSQTDMSIIIYPFFPNQKYFPEKYLYLKDTIPDMIKQEVINQKKESH